MTNQGPTGEVGSINQDQRIATLLHKLKGKLSNFTIIDSQGQPVGRVEDLYLDASRQLKLVISRSTALQDPRCLLSSRLIQDVDPATQSLYVSISRAELDSLPAHQQAAIPTAEILTEKSDFFAGVPDAATEEQFSQSEPEPAVEEASVAEGVPEEVIRLLGERLLVKQRKRKVGEVIIRKAIETQWIEVPVRREKLIVEQVSPELKRLVEIDLGQGEISGIELSQPRLTRAQVNQASSAEPRQVGDKPVVRGEFTSPKAAALLLEAIALQRQHGCTRIRVEIELEDTDYQETYQSWIDRSSDKTA